ncbi:MAG: class I SAM-dependent methyltransferase [Flammeovirgaceae bacterium]|nr:class I SAM-dependent methyltransferase [Flammeovirgaceae bacterium]
MKLTDVSKTSIATSLRSHVIESEKKNPIIIDPMAKYCLDKLYLLASEEEKALLFDRKLPLALTNSQALRARKYDQIADNFISKNPGCTVVNLGCGFDTRYWRLKNKNCEYIELDLPELIEVKKEILKEHLSYQLIGCSVLDTSWIDRVTKRGNSNILLLAEGLFMYLPKNDVIELLKTISERFDNSQIALEVTKRKYTRGLWKMISRRKINSQLGFDAGSLFKFGVRTAQEIESYCDGIKVIEEWIYTEAEEVRPRIAKYLVPKRSQWTVTATLNKDE